MTTEEKIALAKAMGVDFGKTEIVFEKNVEYEIGNVEAGGIGVQVNQGVQTVDNGAKKPAKTTSQSKPATFKMVNDVFDKNDYSDSGVVKTVLAIRNYDKHLGFSRKWITDFVYQVLMLAKKEPKPQEDTK